MEIWVYHDLNDRQKLSSLFFFYETKTTLFWLELWLAMKSGTSAITGEVQDSGWTPMSPHGTFQNRIPIKRRLLKEVTVWWSAEYRMWVGPIANGSRVRQKLDLRHHVVLNGLKRIGIVKKFEKLVHLDLNDWQKWSRFEVCSFLILRNQMTLFWIELWRAMKNEAFTITRDVQDSGWMPKSLQGTSYSRKKAVVTVWWSTVEHRTWVVEIVFPDYDWRISYDAMVWVSWDNSLLLMSNIDHM